MKDTQPKTDWRERFNKECPSYTITDWGDFSEKPIHLPSLVQTDDVLKFIASELAQAHKEKNLKLEYKWYKAGYDDGYKKRRLRQFLKELQPGFRGRIKKEPVEVHIPNPKKSK
jgi:hypothetical protein